MISAINLLENGLDFLFCSIEGLNSAHQTGLEVPIRKRLVRHALGNAISGIEQILKYQLYSDHWTYIFSDMNEARRELLVNGNFNCADFGTLIERQSRLCGVRLGKNEWYTLSDLITKRNRIDFFRFDEPVLAAEAAIYKSLILILGYSGSCAKTDGLYDGASLPFEQIENGMRVLGGYYEAVKEKSRLELERTGQLTGALRCPKCGEDQLERGSVVTCHFCGYEADSKSAAEELLRSRQTLDRPGQLADDRLHKCPSCQQEGFVFDTGGEQGVCYHCGFSCSSNSVKYCSICGCLYYTSVYDYDDIGMCDVCMEHYISCPQ